MADKLQAQLEDILKILPSMPEGQRIALLEMIYKACTKYIEESNKLADIESLYIKGDMGWEESREAKKEIGCFELETNPVINKNDRRVLVEDGIVLEKKHGLALSEPFELTPYRVASRRPGSPVKHKTMQFLRSILRGFDKLLKKYSKDLTTRQSMGAYLSLHVPQEEAIIFSATPAIFNPFEFEEAYLNYSFEFCTALKGLQRPVFYVWNRNSLYAQIRSHIKEYNGSIAELTKKYIDHLSEFFTDTKLWIFLGNTDKYIHGSIKPLYISKDTLIVGKRVDGKFVSGKLIDRKGKRDFMGKLPVIGNYIQLPYEIVESFPELTDFDSLKDSLIQDPCYERFSDHRPNAISNFVYEQFEKAQISS